MKKISHKLLLLTVIFSAFITLFITMLQLYIDYKNGIDSINKQFDLVIESHSTSLVEKIWVFDEDQINLQLKGIVSLPDIFFTSVNLDDGRYYEYGKMNDKNIIEKKFKLIYKNNIQDIHLGELNVIADVNGLYTELTNKIYILLLSQGLKTFIVSLFILYLFQILITKHIQTILSYTNSLSFNKKNEPLALNKKIFNNQDDELDALVDSINKMQTEIYNSYLEVKEQKDILDHQAHHDALTALPNRILFNDRLEKAIKEAKRNNSKIALLFIDLDHFKEINDSLGHHLGDEVLKVVTSKLQESLRDEDTLARLGGDEFTIIFENIHEVQDASVIATKILENLSKSMNIHNHTLYVSSSIGISIYPDDGESAPNLLKYADSAMYKAKNEGRNNYQYYNSTMTELAFERVVMETSLRAALKNNEFIVYYQPQVNGSTNKLIGMEALVRWKHPTMGLVAPDKFIPLAESTGLIVELDRFVMKTAMTQIATWYEEGFNPGILAMNLAVKQFQKLDFISMFRELIQKTNCKPEWLELEVTEGQVMTHPKEAVITLKAISDLGVELAIDDFGTGYSSLAYLKKLPIDKLKIDQAFIMDLPGDEEDEGITKAIIALSKSLNLKVMAEGVETKEQRDFLVENGCENIQGYFYSRPIPADEFENILRNGF